MMHIARGLVVLLVALSSAGPGRAQEPPDTAQAVDRPVPAPDTIRWIGVGERPRSTVVAATITYPTGSADDPEGRGGTAWLMAGTLEAMLSDALGPNAIARVSADRTRLDVTVLAAPDQWESAFQTVVTVLNRRDLADDHFGAERSRLLSRMTFEAGAPVREFEYEAARLYAAGESRWARPPDGAPETLQAITLTDLERFRETHLRPERAVVSVVGSVDANSAVATAARLRGGARRASGGAGMDEPSSPAWLTGARQVVAREITNTALAFAYPLPAGHDRTEAEFLAYVLQESLNQDPPDPRVYNVEAWVADAPSGSLVVIEATVFPEAGERWEGQIQDAVRTVQSTNPAEDVFFPWRQRRFRSEALLADAAPEGFARRLNSDLLREGSLRDLSGRIDALTADGLVELANALGMPRILYFGPDLADRQ